MTSRARATFETRFEQMFPTLMPRKSTGCGASELTGADAATGRRALETSRDGVFAVCDVRAGSTKRVAAAVGEGAQVIATFHACLASERARGRSIS